MERYSLENGKLHLQDEELGIDIHEPFAPCEVNHNHFSVPTGRDAYKWVAKDEQGNIAQVAHSDKGHFHGPLYHYFSSGQLASLTWFYQGLRIGKAYKYFPSGGAYAITHFSDRGEKLYSDHWYETGQVRSQIPYKAGRVHGTVRLYWPNGELKRVSVCERGAKVGKEQFFDEAGKLIEEGVLAYE